MTSVHEFLFSLATKTDIRNGLMGEAKAKETQMMMSKVRVCRE